MTQGFASQSTHDSVKTNSPNIPTLSTIKTHLTDCFSGVEDPRVNRTKKHLLKDILVIAILAVIAGANGWEDMENYGLSKQLWLRCNNFSNYLMVFLVTIHFVVFLSESILKYWKNV